MNDSPGKMQPQGNWPDVDVQVIKDYLQPASKSKVPNDPSCVLRLHMDIGIDEADANDFMKHLKNGAHKDLYARVLEIHGAAPKDRGAQVLRAALNLDDYGNPRP